MSIVYRTRHDKLHSAHRSSVSPETGSLSDGIMSLSWGYTTFFLFRFLSLSFILPWSSSSDCFVLASSSGYYILLHLSSFFFRLLNLASPIFLPLLLFLISYPLVKYFYSSNLHRLRIFLVFWFFLHFSPSSFRFWTPQLFSCSAHSVINWIPPDIKFTSLYLVFFSTLSSNFDAAWLMKLIRYGMATSLSDTVQRGVPGSGSGLASVPDPGGQKWPTKIEKV